MENSDWRRLGDAVQARRHLLELTQEDVTEKGGPSHQTLRRIEQGDPGPYQRRTLARLERVLGWRPGTSQAILDGVANDNPDEWVEDEAKPGGVTMTHPDLPGQPIEVPEAAVPGHEGSGWRVSGGRPVAQPGLLDRISAERQQGQHHYRQTFDSALASDSVTARVTPATDSASVEVVITRDAAVVALLKYEQALEDRGGADPIAVAARSEVRKLIRRLLSLTPTPAALEWMRGSTQQLTSALEADQDGAD